MALVKTKAKHNHTFRGKLVTPEGVEITDTGWLVYAQNHPLIEVDGFNTAEQGKAKIAKTKSGRDHLNDKSADADQD